jgi:hypothetical protein
MRKTLPISLIFFLTTLLFFVSCKEDEIANDLKLDKNYVEIKEGETAIVTIESGNGTYTVSISSTGIVTAEIAENSIVISAMIIGETTLVVEDAAGKSASVRVKVISSSNELDAMPHFIWTNDTIELEKPNDWGFTLFSERLAITHIPDKKQYVLSWSGGMSVGPKSNGLLKIVKGGELIQSIHLTTISISDDSSLYYKIDFNKNDQNGRIVFPK